MRVSVIGSGYVGLVSGAGFSQVGHNVVCMDIDASRVERLSRGECTIYEPGLESMLVDNLRQGRLEFTTSMDKAVAHAEVLLIAVGTPPGEDGSADLSYVLAVAEAIGDRLEQPLLVVVKSTVPVGTCDRVRQAVQARLDARGADVAFSVASNPEFLAEGVAVSDFMRPDRIIAGVENEASEDLLRELYAPFNRNHEKLMFMDLRSSELTKYAANAMLATRISAMNELANVAEHVGADIEKVRLGIGSDPRIGYSFIYPGAGYGGSCFPKDVRALCRTASEAGYETRILDAVESVNNRQRRKVFDLLSRHFGGDLDGRRIAMWGLAFKPNTDDTREAPALVVIDALLEAGATIHAHDPKARDVVAGLYPDEPRLVLHENPYEAAEQAEALALVTEWRQYWAPDFRRLAETMAAPVLVDGRNIWSPDVVRGRGFTYYAIGRP
ncbi:UDP-glucose/GDP-mannose dehydrogenase family protein [Marinihelvus fidelis]|uniref:UDP-glucose 6-dehydrogenase n=1 Tax=Marinihelvus fidelis TaxID=2613842 RepID=A0A5N0TF97_9GAMM|nr:UDP-glucose/GDP-mannose dehydrogenase family protein [Marinihelvus fidelis]KAA9133291.1 UDP-glucose/GDP-mannose dehydrogenase family protein [Marinihelvus fidelis]